MTVLVIIQAVLLFAFRTVLKAGIMTASIILIFEAAAMIYLFEYFQNLAEEQSSGVKTTLGSAANEAYLTGGIGLVIYDDNYIITWMSELFAERGINQVGHRFLTWVPEADDLIS